MTRHSHARMNNISIGGIAAAGAVLLLALCILPAFLVIKKRRAVRFRRALAAFETSPGHRLNQNPFPSASASSTQQKLNATEHSFAVSRVSEDSISPALESPAPVHFRQPQYFRSKARDNDDSNGNSTSSFHHHHRRSTSSSSSTAWQTITALDDLSTNARHSVASTTHTNHTTNNNHRDISFTSAIPLPNSTSTLQPPQLPPIAFGLTTTNTNTNAATEQRPYTPSAYRAQPPGSLRQATPGRSGQPPSLPQEYSAATLDFDETPTRSGSGYRREG